MNLPLIVMILILPQLASGQGKKVEVLDLSQEGIEFNESVEEVDVSDETQLKIEEIIEPPEDYRYSSFGNSDPFRRPPRELGRQDSSVGGGISGQSIPIVSPLQNFPVEQLQVKGIWINRSGQARAVIMTPDKQGVIIKQGDPISAGKVMLIERDHIKVRQYILKADGSRQFKDIKLAFGKALQSTAGSLDLEPGGQANFTGMSVPPRQPADQLVPGNNPNAQDELVGGPPLLPPLGTAPGDVRGQGDGLNQDAAPPVNNNQGNNGQQADNQQQPQ